MYRTASIEVRGQASIKSRIGHDRGKEVVKEMKVWGKSLDCCPLWDELGRLGLCQEQATAGARSQSHGLKACPYARDMGNEAPFTLPHLYHHFHTVKFTLSDHMIDSCERLTPPGKWRMAK